MSEPGAFFEFFSNFPDTNIRGTLGYGQRLGVGWAHILNHVFDHFLTGSTPSTAGVRQR